MSAPRADQDEFWSAAEGDRYYTRNRDVLKAKAEGDAASVLEEGRARAAAVECIGQAIQKHPEALKVMLVEMMPGVVAEVAKSVNNIELGEVTVIDGGNGHAIAGAAMGRARALSETLAMLENILGVDFRELSRGIAGRIATTNDNDQADRPGEASVTAK